MPSPSTQQSFMNTKDGNVPILDANGFLADLAWKPKVVAKTAAYTVNANESGTIFVTEGATAAVTFTLPAASDGPWVFEFFAAEDFAMTVAAATADTMVCFNDVAADSYAFSTASEIIGGSVRVFSAGGAVVYVQDLSRGGHVQTATIATA